MSSDKKAPPVSFTTDELKIINNALNEICHGLHFGDDELTTRLGYGRKQIEAVLAKVGRALAGK
jgi:tetrahydromethanopterin S-methyltransferase subunit G